MNILNNENANYLIKEYLTNNNIFALGRVGITELHALYYYDNNINLPQDTLNFLRNNAGVYGNNIEDFYIEYMDAFKNSDIHVYWEHIHNKNFEKLYTKYCKKSVFIQNRGVEPFYFDDPWSQKLEGKKVLVIHPFVKSIQEQYNKRDKIWKNSKILPNFELILYKPVQSIGNTGPHESWIESLNIMKNDIQKIDFDIAIMGCGAYGMPLSNFIKTKIHKTAIYIGGGLQILFGIMGNRWDNHEISNYYNKYWIRPSFDEKPPLYKTVENGCYW
jgi:hypothetical protein